MTNSFKGGAARPTVAIVGATGNVGRLLLETLERRSFPVGKLVPMASARSIGKRVLFRGEAIAPVDLATQDFQDIDLVLASAGATVSREFAPRAIAAGAVIVDNSSAFRMDEGVPLVIPEANADALAEHRGLIANPNCTTAQLIVAIAPIHREAGIRRLIVSTYQSVSGTGKAAMDELREQARRFLDGGEVEPDVGRVYPHPIAFNVLPQCDAFTSNGYTKEEMKVVNETRKILGDPTIAVTATAVRVPVFRCHSEAVNVETRRPLSMERLRQLLDAAPGLRVVDDPARLAYPTPLYAQGLCETLIGRLREDISNPGKGFDIFVVSDNLLKGAAWNAVQIAEELLSRGLLRVPR